MLLRWLCLPCTLKLKWPALNRQTCGGSDSACDLQTDNGPVIVQRKPRRHHLSSHHVMTRNVGAGVFDLMSVVYGAGGFMMWTRPSRYTTRHWLRA